uniref:Ig-like domain-containing protein n=1 Tax=Labrus bergylta TaxID=56723 RepID=A0A3Q3EMW3_9LABR
MFCHLEQTTSSKPTVFPLMQCGSETANTVTLGCLATAGTALTDFIQYPPVEKSGVYTGISQIKVNKEDLDAKQPFKCIASNTAGDGEGIFIVTRKTSAMPIYKEPTLKVFSSCDGGEEVSFSCFAKDFAPKQYEFKWLKNDGAASFLTVPASEWTQDTKYVCEFKGKGMKASSVFMLPPLEHTRKEMVTLSCYVKLLPKEVYVSWLVDDEKADSKYGFHTTKPVENQGSYRHIARSLGQTSQNINLVNLNMNIPETCKASRCFFVSICLVLFVACV